MPTSHLRINIAAAFAVPGCGCGCECCDVTEMPDLLYRAELDGQEWITDRHLLLRADFLDSERFSGGFIDLTQPKTVESVTALLAHERDGDEPSQRLFQGRFLDAVEGAGLRVRPMTEPGTDQRAESVHGVFWGDERVGMLMPIAADADEDTIKSTRARVAL